MKNAGRHIIAVTRQQLWRPLVASRSRCKIMIVSVARAEAGPVDDRGRRRAPPPRCRDRPQSLLQRAAALRRAGLRLLDRQRHLARRLCAGRAGAGRDRPGAAAPAPMPIGWRRCADGSARPTGSPTMSRSCSRRRAPTSNMSLWPASRAARPGAPTPSCSAPTRSAPAASIRRTASISPSETALGAAVKPGPAGARARRRPCRAGRHSGPRPDGAGAALPLPRRADAGLDRRRPRRQPAQPRPCRPRLQDRADPALARRRRPADRRPWRAGDLGGRRLPGADHRRRR